MDEDNWRHPVETTDFIYQRYVLVLFYFMMGEQSQFKPKLKVDECQWERIVCNKDRFVETIKFGT